MFENLWSFATRIYAGPDMAAHCLDWQQQYGADVDVLLAGLWLASRQSVWSMAHITALNRHCAIWRSSSVLPLRATRQALVRSDLYPALKQVELLAERTQLDMIARWLDDNAIDSIDLSPVVCAERNLMYYAQQLAVPSGVVAIQVLARCCAPLLNLR